MAPRQIPGFFDDGEKGPRVFPLEEAPQDEFMNRFSVCEPQDASEVCEQSTFRIPEGHWAGSFLNRNFIFDAERHIKPVFVQCLH